MSAKLIAEEGLVEGLVLSFDEGDEWVVGRDPAESQVLIADPEVSRKHLVLRRSKDGLTIENLSQTNPVQINDEALTAPRLLRHGDALKIGGSRFRFYTEIGGSQIEGLNGEEEKSPVTKSEEASTTTAPESPVTPAPAETVSEPAPEVPQKEEDSFFDKGGTSEPEHDLLAKVDFGLEEAGPFMLKVIRGPNNGAEFSMVPGRSYVIGTASNVCDVVFHDISVSRQHAKITIDSSNKLFIEDMGSRNGVMVDDVKIKDKVPLAQNAVVTIGTSSFIVFDRESERQTLITPLLPSIVRTLQKEESKRDEKAAAPVVAHAPPPPPPPPPKKSRFLQMLVGLMVLLLLGGFALGTSSLFKSQAVEAPAVDAQAEIAKVITAYPSMQFTFNKETGRLLLIGHVLTAIDRSQLLYQLQTMPYIKSIDDSNLIIDEYVWKETNQILNKNPQWTGISVHAPAPGRFIVSGYLKTRKQAAQLNDFFAQNFRYLDRLENRVVVEEDELNNVHVLMQDAGLRDVNVEMSNGEVTLSGTIPRDKEKVLQEIIAKIKDRPTVRLVKNFTAELEPEQSIINLSDSYTVTGSAELGNNNLSVVINGRILTKGDQLDGMTITDITKNSVLLERDNVKYKIDYNK